MKDVVKKERSLLNLIPIPVRPEPVEGCEHTHTTIEKASSQNQKILIIFLGSHLPF